jgi:hypothetical protein
VQRESTPKGAFFTPNRELFTPKMLTKTVNCHFSHGPLAKQEEVGKVPQFISVFRTPLEIFVDKNEARVVPVSGVLYSGDVYISTDYLDMICCQHLSQMERKAKPVIAKPPEYLRQL